MRLRCRSSKGVSAIGASLSPSSTVADLKRDVEKSLSIPFSRIKIKAGFPPKYLSTPDTATLSESGIKDGEQLHIEEDDSVQPAAASSSATSSSEVIKMDDGYLVVREMEDDNSCLFHAIGYIFERNAAVAGNLRKVVSENILKDPVTYNEVILGKKESEYAKWILNAQSWGGAIELALFSTHFQVEICSVDVSTLRADRFGEMENYSRVAFVLYSGIHYDAVALTPEIGAAGEFDVTVFERKDAEKALEAALGLAKMWKEKKKFTDLATFTLKCGHCQKGLKGQNEAQEHALKTGHASFTEYS